MRKHTVFQIWLLAIRPKTLVAAVVPVGIGAALAGREIPINFLILFLIMASAICIQIGTNLTNDYSDFKSGADTEKRLGPKRVTQAALLSPKQVARGAALFFALAVVFGLPLIARGGWEIFFIGAVGILCGWAYTAGPFPLGYNGLGELFVLLFFGLFAVAGTHYLLSGFWNAESFWLGLCPGLLSSALLAVNNVRDIETDRVAGKKTLAARFGRTFGRIEVAALLLMPYAILLLAVMMNNYPLKLLSLFSLPFLYRPLKLVFTRTDGLSLNIALIDTAKINLIFGLLLIVDLSL